MPKKINPDPNYLMPLLTEKFPRVLRKPNSLGPVWKVIFPKEGGIDSYFKGYKYPYPGYRSREPCKTIEFLKRTFMETVTFLASMKKIDLFKLLFLKRMIKRLIPRWLNFAIWTIRDVRYKPKLYSRPVREVYRLFNILIERETSPGMKEKWTKIRDIVCMILEVDNAYRFRFQDIIAEMKIDEIKPDKKDKYFFSFKKEYKFKK